MLLEGHFPGHGLGEGGKRHILRYLPELVEPHWYEYLLHRFYGARLRTQLFLNGGRNVVVISTPWYLEDR